MTPSCVIRWPLSAPCLAYVRTALALLAAGAVLLHFFPGQSALFALGCLLGAGGGATLVIGVIRFIQVNRQLGTKH